MNKITRALVGISLLIMSGSAAAIAITGTINIGGGSKVINNGATSTGINFNCGAACGGSVNMFPPPTGTFAGLGGLSTQSGNLTLSNFLYSNIPSQTIWQIDYNGLLYSFNLNAVSVVSGNSGNFSLLTLAGGGFFNITNSDGSNAGYTSTPGTWHYSQSGASFSSQSVPEPGTIALLGLGLVGIGVARRFKKAA